MNVLVHYPSLSTAPIGVWWLPDGANWPQSHYAVAGTPDEVRARQTMANKATGVSWPDYWELLAQRPPYFAVYEIADVGDAWTPTDYLDMLRKVAERRLGSAS